MKEYDNKTLHHSIIKTFISPTQREKEKIFSFSSHEQSFLKIDKTDSHFVLAMQKIVYTDTPLFQEGEHEIALIILYDHVPRDKLSEKLVFISSI